MTIPAQDAHNYHTVVLREGSQYVFSVPQLLIVVRHSDLAAGYAETIKRIEQTLKDAQQLNLLEIPAPGIEGPTPPLRVRTGTAGVRSVRDELRLFFLKMLIVVGVLGAAAFPVLPDLMKISHAIGSTAPSLGMLIDRVQFTWRYFTDPTYVVTPEEREHFLRKATTLAERSKPYVDALTPLVCTPAAPAGTQPR